MYTLIFFVDTYNDAQNSWPTAAIEYYQENLKLESAYKN